MLQQPKKDLSKLYIVGRPPESVSVYNGNSQNASLIKKLPHTMHHSQGFAWGYEGSGPADLALNILDYIARESGERPNVAVWKGKVTKVAWDLHQDFKRTFVATWELRSSWVLRCDDIYGWMQVELREKEKA